MAYRIEVTPRALKDLKALPTRERQRVAGEIDSLEDNPRPQSCKKLKGRKDFYRVRVGDYRVVYRIEDEVLLILIVRIGDRKEIYEIIRRL
ncbi:MAG: type II toxin-antitoxin system RelE/ParE family toxin [Gemmatimonadota bacterium]